MRLQAITRMEDFTLANVFRPWLVQARVALNDQREQMLEEYRISIKENADQHAKALVSWTDAMESLLHGHYSDLDTRLHREQEKVADLETRHDHTEHSNTIKLDEQQVARRRLIDRSLARTIAKMQHRSLVFLFERWSTFSRMCRRVRSVASKAICRLRLHLATKVFGEWCGLRSSGRTRRNHLGTVRICSRIVH